MTTSKKDVRTMTRDELRKEAKKLNIYGRGRMNKAQLLAAVLVAMGTGSRLVVKQKKTKKKAQKPELVNHIAIVIDVSGSMSSLRSKTVEVFNKQLDNIKQESKKTGQKTTVSLITFSDYTRVHYRRKPVESCPLMTLATLPSGGMTALYDATDQASSTIGAAPDANEKTTSFLVLVITDGWENASLRTTGYSLRESISKAQATDRWTYAFLLPNNPQDFARRLGVPEGNCTQWEQSEVGMEDACVLTTQSMSSYYGMRSRGITKSKNFFQTDMTNVSKQKVTKKLHDLSPYVQEATVADRIEIRDFCNKRFGGYVKGAAFYQLMKAETVQNYKNILIMGKADSQIYGGQEARDLLGLPDYNVRVHPGDHGDWLVFVQSTSVNRKVIPGTKLLYAPSLVK